MNIHEWLQHSQAQLETAGIGTARLDCLVLLEDELGKDRAWILSHSDDELQGSVLKKLNTKIVQRALHVPLAYLRGHAEFYGRDFAVNAHTLVPRPETETIIELLKIVLSRHPERSARGGVAEGQESTSEILHYVQNDENVKLVDVGTGSGCIAITAKLEFPEAEVTAIDIDEKCLKIARANAQKLGADITFLHGNLLEPIYALGPKASNLILLTNLPYVPDNFQINTAATHEPRHALFGGPDGLDLYRELFEQITKNNWKLRYILTESLPPQHEVLAPIAKAAGYRLRKTDDFIQLFELI